MDEKEKKLFELFQQKEHLVNQEPSVAAALSPDPQQLLDGARTAQAHYGEGPELNLTTDQRADLGRRRFPELHGVLSLFLEGLDGHQDILDEISATTDTVSRLLRLDMALGRMAWTADLVEKGGESGELLTAAALQGICRGLLVQAEQAAQSDRYTQAQRLAVTAAFTEPRRIDSDDRTRQAQDQATDERNVAPILAQISQAQRSTEMARIIEVFLQQIGRSP